jgi:hypothetical protein
MARLDPAIQPLVLAASGRLKGGHNETDSSPSPRVGRRYTGAG